MALPKSLSKKSCTRVSFGCPCGCHSRPAFLKPPTNSFFLVSTDIPCVLDGLDRIADRLAFNAGCGILAQLYSYPLGLQCDWEVFYAHSKPDHMVLTTSIMTPRFENTIKIQYHVKFV